MLRRLALAVGALVSVLVLGTVGYVLIERWPLMDALYMTVITIGTVGFREVEPLSRAGQAFTMALILAGVGALGFSFGTIVDFMVEGHLKGFLEERRMHKRIEALRDHHIVAGMGRVGGVVARALEAEGARFVVIDSCEDCVSRAAERGWLVLSGDATEEETLLAAGVTRARSLVTALDTDADNLFVTVTAHAQNPDLFIVARSSVESSEPKLRKAGASRVLTPTVIGGRRMAAMVLHPVVSDYLDLVTHGDGIEFRLEEVAVPAGSPYDGRTISDMRIREATGAVILAVHRGQGRMDPDPTPDTTLSAGDRLVALGTRAQLDALAGSV